MNCPECNIELKKAEWDLIDCFVEFTFMQIIYSITLIPFLIITGVIGQVIFIIVIGYFVVTNLGKVTINVTHVVILYQSKRKSEYFT